MPVDQSSPNSQQNGYSKYATPGDNVSLQISNLPKNHRSLTWFYTTDQKIVEWESGEPTKYFDTKFKDRAMLDSQSGTLHIRKVQKEDSSTYLLRVLKDKGHEEEYKIPLMVLGPAASGIPKKLVGAIGGSVIFPLNLSVNLVDSIIWVFNSTTLVTIQPKTADKNALIIVTQKRNTERVNFPHEGYSLKLSRLTKNDSGVYRVEIHNSTLQDPLTQEYELHVYEYLSKPKVIIGLQENKNGTCETNLTCSMEHGEEDVTYSWKSLDQATNESHRGSILPISWRWEKSDMTFICMASNPISSNSSNPIFAQNLCEGAAGGQTPYVILYVLLSFFLLCSLTLVLIILIIRRERKKVSEIIEEKKELDTHQETLHFPPISEEMPEYDTISNFNELMAFGFDSARNANTVIHGITPLRPPPPDPGPGTKATEQA
ncbi:hypothetical protein MJT46_000835 [Ovis ammon polii x Ovis aries]|nr:hypothetical protein MJT46_000835 [Ovis ammon polii x Ovis aries]